MDPVPDPDAAGPAPRTIAEAAAFLGVSERTVRRFVAAGDLAAARRGTGPRFDHAELARFAALRAAPRPARRDAGGFADPPAIATCFVGREAELRRLAALLADPAARLVTLTGPGGVGKTRLALAAMAAGAVRVAFPDGVVFVPLAAVARREGVLPAVGEALGLREVAGVEREAQIADFLRNRRLLLVLDNLEQLLPAAPDLARLLAVPGPTLLATSRARLRLAGERVVDVPPMALPPPGASPDRLLAADAGALFVERARAHDPGFALDAGNAPAVAEVCAVLDGLPLAIELAAARVRALPPAALRRQLGRRLPLLTAAPGDAPARHATMRDAIAWSHDLLPPDGRRLFRRLGVLSGDFDLAAAAAVAGAPAAPGEPLPPAVVDGIDALLDQSLLVRDLASDGEARFRLLAVVREFALDQLGAEEAAEARAAHARHFSARAAGSRDLVAARVARAPIARLAADEENLRAALVWLAEHGSPPDFAALVADSLGFFIATSRYDEGRAWLDRADVVAADSAPPAIRAHLLARRAELLMVAGRFPEAEARYAETLPLLRADGDPVALALALVSRGASLVYGGRAAEGEPHLAEAAAIAERIPDPLLRAAVGTRAVANLGLAARARGDPALAAARAEAALRVARRHGFDLAAVRILVDVADAALDQGAHALALARYRECLEEDDGRDEPRLAAEALDGVASVATAWGRHRDALLLLGAARALRERIGFGMLLRFDRDRRERELAAHRAALGDAAADAVFEEGRDLPLPDALALAASLAPPPAGARADSAIAGLTPREREVLALLAHSLTDREIAERLSLSPRTVSWHVGTILAKLGVSSRRRAAALARRPAGG